MDFVLEGKQKNCRLNLPTTRAIEGEPKTLIFLYEGAEKKPLALDPIISTLKGKEKKQTRLSGPVLSYGVSRHSTSDPSKSLTLSLDQYFSGTHLVHHKHCGGTREQVAGTYHGHERLPKATKFGNDRNHSSVPVPSCCFPGGRHVKMWSTAFSQQPIHFNGRLPVPAALGLPLEDRGH